MLAMSYLGPKKVKAVKKPDPKIMHPNDVVLKVTRSAICGSDIHLYCGLVADTRVGTTFGHEFTGVVQEVGSSVESLKVGDRIMVPFNISCGRCYYCQRSLFGNCELTNPSATVASGVFGYSHTTGGYEGGQAQYVRVPFADVGPMKIPDDMHDEDVLFLTDAFPTGYMAAEMGSIRPGDTVVVFGSGPVGLFAAKSAFLMGAGRVIVVDRLNYRLEFAQGYTGCETVNFEEVDDIVVTLKKMTEGRGADVCIDAVGLDAAGSNFQSFTGKVMMMQAGAATAIDWAIDSVRKAGHVSIVGVYGPPWNLIPIGTAMNKGLTLRMNQCHVKRYMPHLLQLVREGHVDPKAVITHRAGIEEVEDAYHIFANKKENCIKPILAPNGI
ncbi:MAG: zinc-dependent alcohol dehydrogenase [Deltaproteobacteria bacterium]|nr:zinc-dependent alcohol dehydrogenase [Deltaproteobacteria bacterium]